MMNLGRKPLWLMTLGWMLALAPGAAADGFNAVHSADSVDVWAVGEAGTVYRSLDGGSIWASAPQGTADLHGVAAVDASVVIVGDDGVCFVSANGGATFSPDTLAGGANLRDVCLVDANNGWTVGFGGTVLRTTDGGQSWTAQSSGTSEDLHAVQFADVSEGWACGAAGTVLHTTDGGQNWSASTPFTESRTLLCIDFDGSTVLTGGEYAFFARSTNGGTNWTEHDLRIASHANVDGIELLAGGAFWLSGGGGYLRSSSDGAASWSFAVHPVVTGLSDVHFSDSNNGWACAKRANLVLATTDGGANWTLPGGGALTYTWDQKDPNRPYVRGNTLEIDPFNRDKIYCSLGDSVYGSWDRGDTWTGLAYINAGERSHAFFVDKSDTLIWISLSDARVRKTYDGGQNWSVKQNAFYSDYGEPIERDPNDPQRLIFAPEDGSVRESTDFGETWTTISTPGFRSPCDIVILPDSADIVYLGDGVTGVGNGEIFRSTDGGLNFSLIYTGSGSEIPMLSVTPHDNSFAYASSWSSGGMRKSTDYGASWPQLTTTSSPWGNAIASDDPNVMMFCQYSGGLSHLSTDAGATFETSSFTGSSYGVLVYDRGTYIITTSSGIWKATAGQSGMPVDNAELLTLTAPNGGETWTYNEVQPITWTSQNLTNVQIEYSVDGGGWQPITASTGAAAGSYAWTIPDAPSSDVRVRVSDAVDSDPMDESDNAFSIIVPSIATVQSELDYGAVPVNETAVDTVRIVNAGTATLVITDVTTAGSALTKSISSAFTPSRTSFSIPAGSSDTIAVEFAPLLEQAYFDTLIITSSAPSTPTLLPLAGSGSPPVAVVPGAPARFELRESVPNPFGRAGTAISYAIPRETDVSLVVYNAAGREVATLVGELQPAGRYAVRFPDDASAWTGGRRALSSGIYFYRLRAGDFAETKRMVFIR